MRPDSIRGRHREAGPLLATVSGVASTTISMIDWFARKTCFDIITTKSIERIPNPGNREPVITEPRPGCFGNAVGLRNPGMHEMLSRLTALREEWRRDPPRAGDGAGETPLLNVSLSGSSAGDFAVLAEALSPVADMLELNFSCPHAGAGYGAAIGSSRSAVREITRAVKAAATVPVFVKLTPNVEDIAAIAAVAVESGADGIVAINTVGPAVYVEPDSGKTVLTNPPDGRGGMSGDWIYGRALDAVAAIRKLLGPDIPLIGMGGVSSAERAAEMHAAGADAVGIGSVLGTRHQREWPDFAVELKRAGSSRAPREARESRMRPGGESRAESAPADPDTAEAVPAGARIPLERTSMSYRRCTIARIEHLEPTIVEVTLEESLECGAGQTFFLWIPGVGEKPFAVGAAAPAVFVVKLKGAFTRALAELRPGDRIYLRGPYGDRHTPQFAGARGGAPARVLMAVAGTGIAAVSLLAHELIARGDDVRVLLGLRDSSARVPLRRDRVLARHTQVVYDEGVVGRVLDTFADRLANGEGSSRWTAVYAVGPEPFLDRAVDRAVAAGLEPDAIFVSLERTMLCGVGLCGACSCGGELTCRNGTFVTAEKLGSERFRDVERSGDGYD